MRSLPDSSAAAATMTGPPHFSAWRPSAATRSDRLRESSIGKQSRLTAMMPRRTLGMLCMVLLLLLSVVSLRSVLSPEVLLQDVAVKRREVSIEDGRAVGHLGHVLEGEGGLDRFLRGPAPGERPAPGGGGGGEPERV